jgi:hypothetical protein
MHTKSECAFETQYKLLKTFAIKAKDLDERSLLGNDSQVKPYKLGLTNH